ncbi:IKBZ inhibitor, partial [Origma solitaria]|nr:IKBZ inhibitor [Origma solitaria]
VTFPDSELSPAPPRKRYMGVRVKMPVRELLRKIRLSKGLDPAHSKNRTLHVCFPPPSSALPGPLLLFQSKQSPKGLEDLDILVEVLQEDLNRSQLREEPHGFGQGFPGEPQSSRWEALGSQEGSQGGQHRSAEPCPGDFHPILRGQAEPSPRAGFRGCGSPGMLSRTGGWWGQPESSLVPFPGSAHTETRPQPVPVPFPQHDLSALSFFQFQLRREESALRNIPAEKLLAPDGNGNRLLHKAVAQGRRALTFALAQRFASLNKIDEKDAEKRTALHLAAEKNQHLMVSDLISLGANVNEQDSSGKTPLHLCAENGYLRVLEVLKNCKNNGVRVEVDLPDHYGLTPLHCAALAHTVLVTESQRTAPDTDLGRFLRLRKEQILEGILCLLQM